MHGAPGDAGTAVAAATAAAAAGAAESSAPQPTQRHSTSPSHRPQDFKYIKSNKAGTRWQALLSYKTTSGKWTQFRGHLVRCDDMDAWLLAIPASGLAHFAVLYVPLMPSNVPLMCVRLHICALTCTHKASSLCPNTSYRHTVCQ